MAMILVAPPLALIATVYALLFFLLAPMYVYVFWVTWPWVVTLTSSTAPVSLMYVWMMRYLLALIALSALLPSLFAHIPSFCGCANSYICVCIHITSIQLMMSSLELCLTSGGLWWEIFRLLVLHMHFHVSGLLRLAYMLDLGLLHMNLLCVLISTSSLAVMAPR